MLLLEEERLTRNTPGTPLYEVENNNRKISQKEVGNSKHNGAMVGINEVETESTERSSRVKVASLRARAVA